MKILVTGATGFLGKYVIDELLAHDYTIVALAETYLKALEGERTNLKGFEHYCELRQLFSLLML